METLNFESVERMFEQIRELRVLRVRRSACLRGEGYILRAGGTEVMLIPNSWVERVPGLAKLEISQQEFERFLDEWVEQYHHLLKGTSDLNKTPRGIRSVGENGH